MIIKPMPLAAAVLALSLAGCNNRSPTVAGGGVSAPGPRPTKPIQPSPSVTAPEPPAGQPAPSGDPMQASAWWFEHSIGMPARPSEPWHFDFPAGDGVHACVTNAFRPQRDHAVRLRFRLENTGNLRAYNGGQPAGDPYVSLFLQRQGDNLSAQGAYASYRFYSDESRQLMDGDHDWQVMISPDGWHNVWGQDDSGGFDACLANLRVFGLVFGNPGAGATAHGVGGGGRFTLLSIEHV